MSKDREASSPIEDIQEMVGEFVDGMRAFAPGAGARFPRYDLVEAGDVYRLHFDVPGVPRADIDIRTRGDQVVVSGARTRPQVGEDDRARREERPFGPFRRSARVPADVDLEGIRAALEDGVLTVTLPKRAEQAGRRVDIDS